MTAILFVGESPPLKAPAGFRPFDCKSGDRLARLMLGLRSRAILLDHVPRANIFLDYGVGCPGGPKWSLDVARSLGAAILRRPDLRGGVVVALGDKPLDALGRPDLPALALAKADVVGAACDAAPWILALPHPSGRSTKMNSALYQSSVRAAVLPEVVLADTTLRPWHFDLRDRVVLRDLAVAVAPLRPHVAAAALVVATELREHGPTGSRLIERAHLRLLAACLRYPGDTVAVASERIAETWNESDLAKQIANRARYILRERTLGDETSTQPDPAVYRATLLRHREMGLGGS